MFELLLLAPAAAAVSDAPAKSPSIITNPDWARIPTQTDMAKFYPPGATEKGLSGRATISCAVTTAGDLASCVVMQEQPLGEGFGAAALSLSSIFKMKPKTLDGKPIVGGTVRIPIRFVTSPKIPEMEEAVRCYGALSALTEADPNEENWRRTILWSTAIGARVAMAKSGPSAFEVALAQASTRAKGDLAASRAIAAQCKSAEPNYGQPKP